MGRHQQYEVTLTKEERSILERGCKKGNWSPRKVKRAQILLLADVNQEDIWVDKEIAKVLNCANQTVTNIRKGFTVRGLKILDDKTRTGRPKIVDGEIEARIIAVACSPAPKGKVQWTLRMLADKAVELKIIESISHTTVERTLKKMNLNLT